MALSKSTPELIYKQHYIPILRPLMSLLCIIIATVLPLFAHVHMFTAPQSDPKVQQDLLYIPAMSLKQRGKTILKKQNVG